MSQYSEPSVSKKSFDFQPFCTVDGLRIQAASLDRSHQANVERLLRCRIDRSNLCASPHYVSSDEVVTRWCCDAASQVKMLFLSSSSGVPVGMLRVQTGKLSYLVEKKRRRRGIAKAGICWLIENFYLQGDCLQTQMARHNLASRRTLESVGFRFVGLDEASVRGLALLNFIYVPVQSSRHASGLTMGLEGGSLKFAGARKASVRPAYIKMAA
jgi:hypothetical protein